VLNAQYRSVLATLEMIDTQRSLLSRPALPGQDPAWSLDQQQGQQAIEWAKVRADLDEIREMQQMLDKALEQNARWLNTPAYPGHAGRTIDIRLQLLQQRGRSEEVVRLFEQNPQLPYTANGYGAVAASYLVLKQPEKPPPSSRRTVTRKT
jgi:hypothetical protein